ncbi:MAG TPA: hypothetical protein PKY87_16240 [Terricaulis sp.]|nr:hypothetical protein [Terricaulis sp.]
MTFTLSGELVLTLLINVALIAAAWATLRAQVSNLVEKAKGQDGLSESVTRLTVEVEHLQNTLKAQPALVATVVAAALKEVLTAMRARTA